MYVDQYSQKVAAPHTRAVSQYSAGNWIRNSYICYVKNMYIIEGPNGAGKTTLSYTILPEIFDCDEFVNADEIAKGISPLNPDKAGIRAGRLMLQRIKELLNQGESFAFETTLSTKSYQGLIKKAE